MVFSFDAMNSVHHHKLNIKTSTQIPTTYFLILTENFHRLKISSQFYSRGSQKTHHELSCFMLKSSCSSMEKYCMCFPRNRGTHFKELMVSGVRICAAKLASLFGWMTFIKMQKSNVPAVTHDSRIGSILGFRPLCKNSSLFIQKM